MKAGVNYNYYDDPKVARLIEPLIVKNISTQIEFGCNPEVVYCLGQGKNFSYLQKLNDQYRWWKKVVALPHPRWIMQYKLRTKDHFIERYKDALSAEG